MSENSLPHALLFTAPGCPHCPGVKAALEKLQQEGLIAELEVLSVAEHSERAAELGVRSVPWLQLGEFTLTGAQSPQQLRQWAEKAASAEQEIGAQYENLLANGQLTDAEGKLQANPADAEALLALLEKPDTPIHVRIGVSALLEALEGSDTLKALVPALIALSEHSDHRLRSDACHLLGLSHAPEAEAALKLRLEDSNPEVREIAAEVLEELRSGT